ncbi:carboxypeptidase-like regulatory domain-containing protein [Robertkochia flava]|uniref:carboxypeptidase-like regulatory domain-containing protein n=1 Tax=Robertkochia flava TaxID=3447986 RepID=UPI001CCE5B36|nr:carboxypeptidase-like regulatory domain-containing protein [Robertkochia marina]
MKTLFSFLVAFFCAISCLQAQSVSGKVVDQQEQPVPFATVQAGARYGVITNIEGEFTFNIPDESISDSITISCLGFETLEIALGDFSGGTIVLREKVTELDEVLVSNKQLTPEEIVGAMMEVAPELHQVSDFSEVFFMRNQENQRLMDFSFEVDKASKTSRSDLRTLNSEVEALTQSLVGRRFNFFTEYYGDHLRLNDSVKVNVERSVILKDKKRDISSEEITKKLINTIRPYLDTAATYKVKTGLIKVEDSLKTDEIFEQDLDSTKGKTRYVKSMLRWKLKDHQSFYKNEDLDFLQKRNRYTYALEGYSNIDGESVYIIAFSPKRGSAMFLGKMYINVFDFGLMRMEYEMQEGEHLQNINLKLLLGIKYREDRVKVMADYRKNEDGKYYLKFGRKSSGMYAYISRPLKFIKNREDRSDNRQVFKIDFMFELDNVSTSEIYIAENNPVSPETFKAVEEQERFQPLEIEVYDPGIWEGYNIIAPIEAIRNYGNSAKEL